MSAHRTNRSQFDSLGDTQRVHVRQSAQTLAEQGLGRRSSDHPHKPGDTGGTYNGGGAGSTEGNTGGGVELLARVISNSVGTRQASSSMFRSVSKPPAPRVPSSSARSSSATPWRPKAKAASRSTGA